MLLLILALSPTLFADTIRLKDGTVVKGRIISFGGGKFVVALGDGTRRKELSFAAGEVESIQFDQTAEARAGGNVASKSASTAAYIPAAQQSKVVPKVITTDTAKPAAVRPAPIKPAQSSASMVKPIQISVSVSADDTANGWTNSGWVVKKGQRIRITGEGEISLGGGRRTGPSGSYELEDAGKLLKSVPTGALIAVIGDDNNDFIYVGSGREITAARDGALFLGVNEGNLKDNSGRFSVKVEIDPISGS